MIAIIATEPIFQCVQELNARNLLQVQRITGNNASQILHSIESSDGFTHAVIDIECIRSNIDAALDLLDRLTKTASATKIIVVAANHEPDSSVGRDLKNMGITTVLHSYGAMLKRQLNAVFVRDRLYEQEAVAPEQPDEPEAPEDNEAAAVVPIDITITPPSQVSRVDAKLHMRPKPPSVDISRALTIAVAGAGGRIGTTTQAMQIALYLKGQDESVAIVQINCRNTLFAFLDIMEEHQRIDENHCIINGVDLFLSGNSIAKAKRDFRYLVCDYGNFNALADVSAFLDKDVKVLVAGTQPWEMEQVEPVFEVDDGNMHYVFSFAPTVDQPSIKKLMADSASKTYFAQYAPDYWSYCGDDETYEQLSSVKPRIREPKQGFGWFKRLAVK